MRTPIIISIVLLVLFFAVGIFVYPMMKESVATHWDAQGEVNGSMNRFWGTFFVPFLALGMFLVFLLMPLVDPLKKNLKKFRTKYEYFIVILLIFMFYLYLMSIFWNLGHKLHMARMIAPAIGVLFFYIGILMKNTEQNWFVGIRNPWTLSSPTVWKKTHNVGSMLFMASGLIAFVGIFTDNYHIWLILVPVLVSSIAMTVYSYLLFRKEKD